MNCLNTNDNALNNQSSSSLPIAATTTTNHFNYHQNVTSKLPNDLNLQHQHSNRTLNEQIITNSSSHNNNNSMMIGSNSVSVSGTGNEVRNVMLYGIPIVSLLMDGQERLCLAQISNTLLKNFSYNEIHNRRVALGITCVQCTPVQLELLRRAKAMPVSSRRCGMITKREAERLCKSFLAETEPPKLPESFSFDVYHSCAWGCQGSFTPSRYNSSRAKCIKCSYCGLFFSPNKFIFHSHRLPSSKYVQPDAANFNSWRRHIKLVGKPEPTDQVIYAWEDVKAMFNGGSRKRAMTSTLNSFTKNQEHNSTSASTTANHRSQITNLSNNKSSHGDGCTTVTGSSSGRNRTKSASNFSHKNRSAKNKKTFPDEVHSEEELNDESNEYSPIMLEGTLNKTSLNKFCLDAIMAVNNQHYNELSPTKTTTTTLTNTTTSQFHPNNQQPFSENFICSNSLLTFTDNSLNSKHIFEGYPHLERESSISPQTIKERMNVNMKTTNETSKMMSEINLSNTTSPSLSPSISPTSISQAHTSRHSPSSSLSPPIEMHKYLENIKTTTDQLNKSLLDDEFRSNEFVLFKEKMYTANKFESPLKFTGQPASITPSNNPAILNNLLTNNVQTSNANHLPSQPALTSANNQGNLADIMLTLAWKGAETRNSMSFPFFLPPISTSSTLNTPQSTHPYYLWPTQSLLPPTTMPSPSSVTPETNEMPKNEQISFIPEPSNIQYGLNIFGPIRPRPPLILPNQFSGSISNFYPRSNEVGKNMFQMPISNRTTETSRSLQLMAAQNHLIYNAYLRNQALNGQQQPPVNYPNLFGTSPLAASSSMPTISNSNQPVPLFNPFTMTNNNANNADNGNTNLSYSPYSTVSLTTSPTITATKPIAMNHFENIENNPTLSNGNGNNSNMPAALNSKRNFRNSSEIASLRKKVKKSSEKHQMANQNQSIEIDSPNNKLSSKVQSKLPLQIQQSTTPKTQTPSPKSRMKNELMDLSINPKQTSVQNVIVLLNETVNNEDERPLEIVAND